MQPVKKQDRLLSQYKFCGLVLQLVFSLGPTCMSISTVGQSITFFMILADVLLNGHTTYQCDREWLSCSQLGECKKVCLSHTYDIDKQGRKPFYFSCISAVVLRQESIYPKCSGLYQSCNL